MGCLSHKEELVKEYLSLALREFGHNPLSTKVIRRFALDTPGLFANAALSILQTPDESPGQRYLGAYLISRPELPRMLADPWTLARSEAIGLFRHLMTLDARLDVRLAEYLPSRGGVSADVEFETGHSERALDILDESSHGRRIVPIVGNLVDHPNARISSKAALVVGKRVRSVMWAERQLASKSEARLRSNAIQSVWGVNGTRWKDLLWQHVRDSNNRVAGTAAWGLHLLGEDRIAKSVLDMSRDERPEFRRTSAWIMAKTGDPRYMASLEAMIKDDHPGVRSTALNALVQIRRKAGVAQAASTVRQAAPEPVVDPVAARRGMFAEPLVLRR